MQTYMVGGAVRDALLGLPVNDHDWVVVGATPQEMILAGYLPVGKDFPVFLHPQTREEYALARTERKTARGYHGFQFHAEPDVTLEQDLARRDLTINAIAQGEDGVLVDPFHGRADLKKKVLRHVTDAFREDPVRILRVARFAARFHDFTIAPETLALMREMVDNGEVDALVAERVWQELARGLMERHPSRMFAALRDCGALERLLAEVAARWRPRLAQQVDRSAERGTALPVRFACLVHGVPQHDLRALCERLRVPNECRELGEVVAREHAHVLAGGKSAAPEVLKLLERCDAIRKPQRFGEVLAACECIEPGFDRSRLERALAAALAVPTHEIAAEAQRQGVKGPGIGERVHHAREAAVARALDE
ncbi:multifunctional CCA tRNA nucleotidyl transferase/2'3'-cyclic phosphodiesterase/2'nucleotidase/phosphatase [Ramlibacter albus]|uniref:Multifunctional CCA tRNA nucleotidyl transferase/2'3'-cyclic phosphodiesterase/2'nucleotidase/phosphatase n=1 Tax=Ramlibacter albus TaxID=2079448 RepID=A0A923M8V2_9BURK|nr:multifunctional CCA tRNA nucleotidyl transferase/2'3'-cyclic phosphodiesterase/2'nucleotidase/phosphatase [Ramlibacter albus]MBC5764879.1 multifunctional CCA tRNA nucleotidyl transferase/2'3'-cyclic phosphodiesterase/2'nucleotidase/phosphatase [Ramlibacter albus]